MKTYEKPTIALVSLTANNSFCTDCFWDAEGDNMSDIIKDAIDGMENPFTEDMSCGGVVEGYCKFTSVADYFVFKS